MSPRLHSNLVVVKLGSGVLTNSKGRIDKKQIKDLARQVAEVHRLGTKVILVSSGAISSGMAELNLQERPTNMASLQSCASIGQPLLMNAYSQAFHKHGYCVAQVLVTHWDLDSRKLYENAQRTLSHLLDLPNCIPIVNENDALSFEEIEMLNTFGDNDQLSAQITLLSRAAKLIILSTIDGLRDQPDGSGNLISRVRQIDQKIQSYAGQTRSQRSVGGMISKLKTARVMLENRIPMVIAHGREENVLVRLIQGESLGTKFHR